jgi:transposase-like protein
MNPQPLFCPNPDCPATGKSGRGNIHVHSRAEGRLRCTLCGHTFALTHFTPFFRLHTDPQTVITVLVLLTHGCPLAAIQAAFGFQRRTVSRWLKAAGAHCQRVHEALVEQERDLGQVQADEIRVKAQGKQVLWLAMALSVPSRLWLGGVVSAARDRSLVRALAARVRACLQPGALLITFDGFSAYQNAFRRALRSPARRAGSRGRPRLLPWEGVVLGQVVKEYVKRQVVAVGQRLVAGSPEQREALLEKTQGGGVLNTSYIERLNATFRARLGVLVRRTRALLRLPERLEGAVWLLGSVYNFCTLHASLTTEAGERRTPAMAAGLTDHGWSVAELLWYRVPPPPWQPPKRRGRRPKQLQQLLNQWCS